MNDCRGCGAPAVGIVRAYCGRSLIRTPGAEQELAVLHDYHLLLSQRRGEELSALLQHGFMPRTEPALIEAGLRCLAALDPGATKACPTHRKMPRIELRQSRPGCGWLAEVEKHSEPPMRCCAPSQATATDAAECG